MQMSPKKIYFLILITSLLFIPFKNLNCSQTQMCHQMEMDCCKSSQNHTAQFQEVSCCDSQTQSLPESLSLISNSFQEVKNPFQSLDSIETLAFTQKSFIQTNKFSHLFAEKPDKLFHSSLSLPLLC